MQNRLNGEESDDRDLSNWERVKFTKRSKTSGTKAQVAGTLMNGKQNWKRMKAQN